VHGVSLFYFGFQRRIYMHAFVCSSSSSSSATVCLPARARVFTLASMVAAVVAVVAKSRRLRCLFICVSVYRMVLF
jgi:hypothetical protein